MHDELLVLPPLVLCRLRLPLHGVGVVLLHLPLLLAAHDPWKCAAVSSSTFGHLAICFPEQAMWLSTRPGLDHAKVRLQWLHVHVQPFWLPSSGLLSWISS